MEIERFLWTDHAELRVGERGLTCFEVEEAVREGHETRESNAGDADWRVYGVQSGGGRFAVIYDHPVIGDDGAVLIVSAWLLRGAARS